MVASVLNKLKSILQHLDIKMRFLVLIALGLIPQLSIAMITWQAAGRNTSQFSFLEVIASLLIASLLITTLNIWVTRSILSNINKQQAYQPTLIKLSINKKCSS